MCGIESLRRPVHRRCCFLSGGSGKRGRMVSGKLLARTNRRAPSAPMGMRGIVPTLLPVCCVCSLIDDETGARAHRVRWVTSQAYRRTHRVNPAVLPLTHTYCPKCLAQVMATVRQYFRESGARPRAARQTADQGAPSVISKSEEEGGGRAAGERSKGQVGSLLGRD